jgi:drug/metabolite transporter (DMT)-like permease
MLLFFHVLRRMDVKQASIGNSLLPFLIALFCVLLLGERITPPTLAGGVVVLVSTLLMTVYEDDALSRLRPATSSS